MANKENDKIKKILSSSKNSYEDKLAILKYIMKKNSGSISSVVSNVLKKK